jgi:hypothetical protein
MNCQEFWNCLPEPGRPLLAAPREHLDQCDECSSRMIRHDALAGQMRTIAATSRHLKAPDRVEARLLSAFRRRAPQPLLPKARPATAAWLSAAAALLVAAGLLITRPPEAPLASTVAPALAEEEYPGFYTLPGAPPSQVSADHLDMVRLEVPASTLITLGAPISVEDASEAVAADFVFGPDGVARAVRWNEE